MSRRRGILLAVGGALLVVAVVGGLVFQPWLLFVDQRVDEADDASAVVGTASGGLSDTAVPTAGASGPTRVVLAAGDFVDAEHGTTGRATIFRRSDGTRFLRITGLDTSNGPDLHVWLTDRPSGGAWGSYDDGAHVRLGELKGNQGDQSYPVPKGADLARMRPVVIWCDRFDVAFGTAPLA
ncbi:DM13 domain-containing protein [Nocardioides sp. LML1-1-1.1]|uniref:DM13 domain-containing protein n=1 Tax=Nocardioides sp. LML1-1-1.1 TaxID=3135248 RepID=UPI0034315F13